MHMGRFYYKRGEYDKALEVLQKGNRTLHIGITYALMGDHEKAGQILHQLENGEEPPQRLAYMYICLGDYDRAFELLEYAVEVNNVRLTDLICDFEYDPIRSDPRFKALQKKMGLE